MDQSAGRRALVGCDNDIVERATGAGHPTGEGRPAVTAQGPIRVGDLHLDAPMPAMPAGRHLQARLLARLHTRPVGEVVFPLKHALTPHTVAEMAWPQIRDAVAGHLAADGLPVPDRLPVGGLAPVDREAGRAGCLRRDATPRITVVIATRDRVDGLLRCLDSMAALDYPTFDVVVVDSAPSTDATSDALRTGRWPMPVRYLRADRPGRGLARNTALPAVTGSIVAFTDDDVRVDRYWLTALAESFADVEVGCVTGLILPAELDTPAQLWVEQAGGFARGFTARRFSIDDPLFPFVAGRFSSGANMAFRTDWLLAVGGFDRAMGAGTPAQGGDDLRAFFDVMLAGRVLVYQPAAIVRRWHRRDYAGLRRQSFGYGVGLGAYLTSTVCAHPALLGAMLRRAVLALRHLASPRSARSRGRDGGFPRELIWREYAGLLAGPLAYGLSRWRCREIG